MEFVLFSPSLISSQRRSAISSRRYESIEEHDHRQTQTTASCSSRRPHKRVRFACTVTGGLDDIPTPLLENIPVNRNCSDMSPEPTIGSISRLPPKSPSRSALRTLNAMEDEDSSPNTTEPMTISLSPFPNIDDEDSTDCDRIFECLSVRL